MVETRFCDECGSLTHTAGETWVCHVCESEALRDPEAETAMATRNGQRDDGAPAVADATQDATETVEESRPAEDCDGDRVCYETLSKPGSSHEVRLFTCVECGHR
ncbi:DNA-directed RNA polymerase subunit M [Halobacteriales archaeon SW_5_70_135]|nr:MAG: DNA-directed RNA polymerase subunit M [Halobacteriales archaeon SW_5_70_135]